jgi:hypothetical protein
VPASTRWLQRAGYASRCLTRANSRAACYLCINARGAVAEIGKTTIGIINLHPCLSSVLAPIPEFSNTKAFLQFNFTS